MKRKVYSLIISFTLIFLFQLTGNIYLYIKTTSINQNIFQQKVKASGQSLEDEDEFLMGRGNNITVNEDGYLSLMNQGNAWINMNPSIKPSKRYFHSMVYDSNNEKVILFGGNDGSFSNETWTYDLETNIWTNMSPSFSPSARYQHSMVYDSHNEKVILFGGNDGSFSNDTWVYDLGTNTWTNMSPSFLPSARIGHSMVYNSKYGKVILFGGSFNDDTWTYDLGTNTWTNMSPSVSPSARYHHSMVYDSDNDKVILFGGDDGSANDETWCYDLVTNTWINMSTTTKPSARVYHSMVYDSSFKKVILYGGAYSGFSYDDTWYYDFAINTWVKLNPIIKASKRIDHSMIYDSINEKVVMFGGFSDGGFDDGTWIYSEENFPQQGIFNSKLTFFDNIYHIKGEIAWSPIEQPDNTSFSLKIGISNTTREGDFIYTDYYNSTFIFEGTGSYIKYKIIFHSNMKQYLSPIVERVNIYYTLEKLKPSIQIINLQNEELVKDTIHIIVNASSPDGIEKVCFYIDNNLILSDYNAPYECYWDSNIKPNGNYNLVVIAKTLLGKESSESILIHVDNGLSDLTYLIGLISVIAIASTCVTIIIVYYLKKKSQERIRKDLK